MAGRWEPYDAGVSRTVLRAAVGAVPAVYSPWWKPLAFRRSTIGEMGEAHELLILNLAGARVSKAFGFFVAFQATLLKPLAL